MTTGVLCTTQDVTDLCGVNANATIIASAAMIDRYIVRAEGVVCGRTKINYRSSSSVLTTDTLNLVKSCVANHAAKSIINQDMSGFTSRAEAVTMLNLCLDEYEKTLKALSDVDTNKYRTPVS